MEISIHLGTICSPVSNGTHRDEFVMLSKGALAIDPSGNMIEIGEAEAVLNRFPSARSIDHSGCIIFPGFIDSHLHYPQLNMIGSIGEDLLGWLEKYTFPEEKKFADQRLAEETADQLINELFANGITTALIFSSPHYDATDALFRSAHKRGLRAVIGKTNMDQNAPTELMGTAEIELEETEQLICQWHGKDELMFYALTPRFAPSCSEKLQKKLSRLRSKYTGLFVQTHLSENKEEVSLVKRLFPAHADYLNVYERSDLLGERCIFAHALHLNKREIAKLAQSKSIIAHCPTSNFFLGSGLFSWQELEGSGVRINLASDIGAGTSLSPWRTMGAAYQMQKIQGKKPPSPKKLFYHHTLCAAQNLGFTQTGSLEQGKCADFQVIDPSVHKLLKSRLEKRPEIEEILAGLISLGDDRLTKEVYVKGKRVYHSD